MKTRKLRFASILLGLVMALSLIPGFAIAANTGTDAQDDGVGTNLVPATIAALSTTQVTNVESSQQMQTANGKPSQVIQATSVIAFVGDQGKNLNAKVVEPASGGGALSYAVKSGSENYIAVDADGALTLKAAPPDNIAYVTVTAAATDAYAETSVDVPVKIYETYDYNIYLQTVQYAANKIYYLNSLDIKLVDKDGKEVGSTTVQNPRAGDNVTVSATNFVDRTYMTAHIQISKNRDPFTLTGYSGVGGAINVYNGSRHSGRIFTCNYGMNAMDPEYTAPVAKTNLVANGSNQTLVHPGSVSVGGNMEYNLGTKDGPDWNWGFGGLGYVRATNPGTYYVWWRTHNTERYSAQYIGQGRSEIGPQCIEVTIAKGTINPTVSIAGWTYGEEPKTPTVTGNTGNGVVTYEYKVKGADDTTYSETVPTDAGEYTVKATIAESKTHNGGTATADFTINKAAVSTQNVRVVGYMGTNEAGTAWVGNFTQSLAGMMPTGAGTLTYAAGDPKFKDGATTLPSGVESFTSSVNSTGLVTATLTLPSTATAIPDGAQEITVPVTVTSEKNYEPAIINVVVMPTERKEAAVSINGSPEFKTYGDAAFTLTATATDPDTHEPIATKAGDWYWYSSDPNVLEVPEVTNTYSASSTMSITVKNPGSAMILAWYEPEYESGYSGTQYIGAAVTESITVKKAPINSSATLAGWTYGAAPNTPSVSGNPGDGAVTYSYSGTTAGGTSYGPSDQAPTQAGTYTVTATVAETANYLGGTSEPAEFTIAPKPITATVTAADKVYDGTTDVNVSATLAANDLVTGDRDDGVEVKDGKVTISGLKGAFATKDVGTNKEVTLNYDDVTSPVANPENYAVTGNEHPTATIAKRTVCVKADDKSSQYGQPLAELTYGLYGPDTLAEGDTLALLGITASTTATSSSAPGDYPITLSGGTANDNYDVVLARYDAESGEDGATYTITEADISKATVTLAQTSYTYDGKAKEPAVKSVVLDGKALVAGTDYDVSYRDNVAAGTAKAVVTGKGNYTGTATATFAIQAPAKQMFRLYNPYSGEHLYTSDAAERDNLARLGWRYEGVGWNAPSTGVNVYRLYNPWNGDHHFTLSAAERDICVRAGWQYEGVSWKSGGSVKIYREYNPYASSAYHNYTADIREHVYLCSIGWKDEGVGWYGA